MIFSIVKHSVSIDATDDDATGLHLVKLMYISEAYCSTPNNNYNL